MRSALHRVERHRFVMDFAVCAKFYFAVETRIEAVPVEQFPGAPSLQNAPVHRERIKPHCNKVDEFNNDALRKLLIWKGVDDRPRSFFDHADALLYFGI